MRWDTLSEGLKFSSNKHRDFIIDSVLYLGVFPTLHSSFIKQKETPSRILLVPNTKEFGWFLSRYEKELDRKWKKPNSDLDLSSTKIREESDWVKFWQDSLDDLKSDIQAFVSNGVDFETLNHHVWRKTRSLVLKSAEDAFQMRLKRYASAVDLKWFQKILWWFRSKILELRWGRSRILFGAYEKYDLAEHQDPAKSVKIFCGYCGSPVLDNNSRPLTSSKLKPLVFDIKGITMKSRSSLAEYEKPQTCFGCGSQLQTAYIHKVGRAVMAVLL